MQLEEAQKTLALRREYDQLAEKITSNRLLKPRAEQHANLDKLNEEIAELERESQEYAQTWSERRDQFGKIIEEGMQLRRLIRDEKEEVERREGMEDDGEEGDVASQRGRSSGVGTPRPEAEGATPIHRGEDHDTESLEGNLQVGTPFDPREKSPLQSQQIAHDVERPRVPEIEIEDTNMKEDGEVSAGPDKSFEGLGRDEYKDEEESTKPYEMDVS